MEEFFTGTRRVDPGRLRAKLSNPPRDGELHQNRNLLIGGTKHLRVLRRNQDKSTGRLAKRPVLSIKAAEPVMPATDSEHFLLHGKGD